MSIYFTADLHFDHAGIIPHANRPFESVEHMNATLIQNWNNSVTSKDTVVILGDFAWKRHQYFLSQLNGKKILIRGNHDKMSCQTERMFTAVYDMRRIKTNKFEAWCCHYCMDSWPSSSLGMVHLYGHSHGRKEETVGRLRCDVGVDIWDFTPVHESIIHFKMQKLFVNLDKNSNAYEIQKQNGMTNKGIRDECANLGRNDYDRERGQS